MAKDGDGKKKKKKTKLEKKNEEIAQLKKELKEAQKLKEIVFKVDRIAKVASDTGAISQTPEYDKSGKVKIISMTKIKSTKVAVPQGSNNSPDLTTSSTSDTSMEAALS